LVYATAADDEDLLGGSVYTIKKNTESLMVASKKPALEVNADKITYMVMSRDQCGTKSEYKD
jgi:hypothetical protein